MCAPPTVVHQALELTAAVVVPQLVTTGTACVGVEFAFSGAALNELHVFAPLAQVEQCSAIVAGLARTMRVHPRGKAVASSRSVFTSERRYVARSVIGQP